MWAVRNYFKSGIVESGISHVLRHTRDDLSRDYHGIFYKTGTELVTMIDDAYGYAKGLNWDSSKPFEVIGDVTRRVLSNGDINYTIEMSGVGYQGGKKGTGGVLNKLKIGVDKNNEIKTSFPE